VHRQYDFLFAVGCLCLFASEPTDNDRAGVEMFAEMIREMRQEKGAEISDKCIKDIENAPNPQAAFVRAAIDIQPG
jgi:hypothetical protein